MIYLYKKINTMYRHFLILIVISVLNFRFCIAQPGNIDTSFGIEGVVITSFSEPSFGYDLAIQNDGKLILVGEYTGGLLGDFAVARYLSDGSLDPSFSSDGKVSTDVNSNLDRAFGVAIQSDGKILVTGLAIHQLSQSQDADYALVRYNIDGSLDNTFGNNGIITTDFGDIAEIGMSIAIQANGRILVTGITSNGFFTLLRYNSNGTLDLAFGESGIVVIGNAFSYGYKVLVQSNSKILVGGESGNDFSIVRYNSNGTLDSQFGNNGMATTNIGLNSDKFGSMIIDNNDKIVLVGGSRNQNNSDYYNSIIRYNSNGIIDSTFGNNGIFTKDLTFRDDYAASILIQDDGNIVVSGLSKNINDSEYDFSIMRITTDGLIDSLFGINGVVITDLGSNEGTADIILDSGGDLVLGGYTNEDFVLVKYKLNNLPLNINNSKISKNLSIFPNPTSNLINVSGLNPNKENEYSIFDVNSRLIFNGIIPQGVSIINLDYIPANPYYMIINNEVIFIIKE